MRLHMCIYRYTLRSCFFVTYHVPAWSTKASFFFLFVSRYLYADPLHCNMTYLLIRLLKDDLKEYTYAARLSGLVYAIASGMNAILVSKMGENTGRSEMAWNFSCSLENCGFFQSKENGHWLCVSLHPLSEVRGETHVVL